MAEYSDGIPDFSEAKSDVIRFRIDDDVFEAFAQIPGGMLLEVTRIETVDDVNPEKGDMQAMMRMAKVLDKQNQRYFKFLDQVLLPESRQRFAERLVSVEHPITLNQAIKVYRMLLSRYGGGFPTQPSSPSSNGHDGTGDDSTVNVPTGGLTPVASPVTDSPISSIISGSET